MINQTEPLIFDGHNDVLSKLWRETKGRAPDRAAELYQSGPGHINAQRAALGGFGGGFFAVWVAGPLSAKTKRMRFEDMTKPTYDIPLPKAVSQTDASITANAEISILLDLHRRKLLTICTSAAEIEAVMSEQGIAAIFHMEGAEAIGPDLHELDVLYAAGLRSLGPVWSRPTAFGEGVPFRFPGDPDIGAGLTDLGKQLVQRCNELRIMLDVSHLNAKGFWDVAELSNAPLVATHSNAHALCPTPRNLTDEQLRAIGESGGMVGLNFATAFLRADGQMNAHTSMDTLLKHLDHMITLCGEDCVGFGSDFDGALVPKELDDVSGLPVLRSAMRAHGYDEALMQKLCHGNWLRVLKARWGN